MEHWRKYLELGKMRLIDVLKRLMNHSLLKRSFFLIASELIRKSISSFDDVLRYIKDSKSCHSENKMDINEKYQEVSTHRTIEIAHLHSIIENLENENKQLC